MKILNTSTKNELTALFSAYQNSFGDEKLNEIVSRQFVNCVLYEDLPLLICGLNPSYRKTEGKDLTYEFDFNDAKIKNDRYFKKFHHFAGSTKSNYIELFSQRHTSQADLHLFLADKKGVEFLVKQLEISQNAIEAMKPKLIFIFNRFAGHFWGRDAEINENGEQKGIWMGYTFEPTDIEGAVKITGLSESPQRINQSLVQTNLIGSIIYFSTFISYRNNKEAMTKIEADVPALIKSLI
jgi:hypothetical protein